MIQKEIRSLLLLFSSVLFGQSIYYGPKASPHFDGPTNNHLIRVQIAVYDAPSLDGVRIKDVSFNNQTVALQSPDLKGFRGEAGFQVAPGTYTLIWNVSRDQFAWPRTIRHKEKIQIEKREEWVQITIQGEEMNSY